MNKFIKGYLDKSLPFNKLKFLKLTKKSHLQVGFNLFSMYILGNKESGNETWYKY